MSSIRDVILLNHFSKLEKKIALLLFILLWIYLWLRAIYVPLLHDEIATFFYYVQSNNYIPPQAHWDANNHLLNSLLTNWSYHLFGQSPLALRLANVFAFAFYFFGAYGISARLKSKLVRWAALLAMVMATYIFEYMGECRGYGLAMAMLLMSLYFTVRAVETKKTSYVFCALFFILLGTTANLTLFISAVLIFGFLLIHACWFDFKLNKIRLLFKTIVTVLMAIPFWYLLKFSFALKARGLLYYGSLEGFRPVTLSTLNQQFIGLDNGIIQLALISLFMLLIFSAIYFFFINRTTFLESTHLLFPYLLIGAVVLIFILAKLLKVNYPEDRAAMYMYIFFLLAIAFMVDYFSEKFSALKLSVVTFIYFPTAFLINLSLTHAGFSIEERHSQTIFDLINQDKNENKFPVTVGGYKTQELCWYYMSNCAGGNQGRLHWTNHPALDVDYHIVADGHKRNPLTYQYYDSIYKDNVSGLILFERKQKLKRKLIDVRPILPTVNNAIDYYNFAIYDMDTLAGKTLYIGAEFTLEAQAQPFISWLTAGIADQNDNHLTTEFVALDWLRKSYGGEQNNVLQGTLIHEVPANAKIMKFYLWNINQSPFSIRDGKCYLYSLERDF